MDKSIQTSKGTAIERLNEAGAKIDGIINNCSPMVSGEAKNFLQSLSIAKGVHDLKTVMHNSPEIRGVVMSMANNRLGFLTDRTPAVLARNIKNGKGPQSAYTYEQLVDPIVEGLLKGYRITNNEINIISGQFYAAKNGNYRKCVEYPGMADFAYNNAPVELKDGGRTARIKCWASWRLSGESMSIGIKPDDELVLQIRVNAFMGEDGVIGKAHSKLFKRIFERISGHIAPESTDVDVVDDAEVVDTDDSAQDADMSMYGVKVAEDGGTEQVTTAARYDGANSRPPAGHTDGGSHTGQGQANEKLPDDWDPRYAEVMKRYVNEKSAIVKRVAEELGIPTEGRVTADVHRDILAFVQDDPGSDQNDARSPRDRFLHAMTEAGVEVDELDDLNAYVQHESTKTDASAEEVFEKALSNPGQFVNWFREWKTQLPLDESAADTLPDILQSLKMSNEARYKAIVNTQIRERLLPSSFIKEWSESQMRSVIDEFNAVGSAEQF